MKTRLINHIQSIQDLALRETCSTILCYDKFLTWPASLSFHHAYEGGLLAHTVEVCDIALGIEQISNGVGDGNPFDRESSFDILTAAALWHDVMKTEEYRLETWTFQMWEHNETVMDLPENRFLVKYGDNTTEDETVRVWLSDNYQKQIGHICGGAAQFQTTAINHGVSRATIDAVTHCLLAHHGRKEWGSPVEPQTLEALILHQADMLSAKFGATKDKQP